MTLLLLAGCLVGGFSGDGYGAGDSAFLYVEIGVDPVTEDLWLVDMGLEPQDSGWEDTGEPSDDSFSPALYRVHGQSHSSRRIMELDPEVLNWVGMHAEFVDGGAVLAEYWWGAEGDPTLHGLVPRSARQVTRTLEGGSLVASPTGEFLLHVLEDGSQAVISADFEQQVPLSFQALDWTADGLLQAQDPTTGAMQLWDPATLSVVREVNLPAFQGEAASWTLRPDLKQALAFPKSGAREREGFFAVDLETGAIERVQGVPQNGRYNQDGSAFYGTTDTSVVVADTETWELSVVPLEDGFGAWVTPDAHFLVMDSSVTVDEIVVVDLDDPLLASSIERGDIDWHPVLVGEALWWSAGEGRVGTLDFETGDVNSFSPGCGFQGGIAWQPISDRVVLRCGDGLNFYERESMVLVDSVSVR